VLVETFTGFCRIFGARLVRRSKCEGCNGIRNVNSGSRKDEDTTPLCLIPRENLVASGPRVRGRFLSGLVVTIYCLSSLSLRALN
jgi:hypothetical protein